MIHDLAAERAVIGVCLNTRHGRERIEHLVDHRDFYVPQNATLFVACGAMERVETLDERVAFAVSFSDVSEVEIRTLIRESPVMFDAGPWAARVEACAKRRAAMQACVAVYEALRDGAEADEARATLEALWAA